MPPRRSYEVVEEEEPDADFFEQVKAQRARKEKARKAKVRAFWLTTIPIVLLFANCIVVPAACNRVKQAEEQQVEPDDTKSKKPETPKKAEPTKKTSRPTKGK